MKSQDIKSAQEYVSVMVKLPRAHFDTAKKKLVEQGMTWQGLLSMKVREWILKELRKK